MLNAHDKHEDRKYFSISQQAISFLIYQRTQHLSADLKKLKNEEL